MAARVPARHALAVGIGKHLRDTLGDGTSVVVGTSTEIGDAVLDYLQHPQVRPQVTTFTGELHAAGLDAEARPSEEADRG